MRYKLLLFAIAAVLAGVFAALYLPARSFPYEFDDMSNVIQNRSIRYLSHPRIFFESEYSRSRPLTSITFAVSYAFSGLSLSALRIPSFLIHALSALLVGLLFLRLFSGRRGAGAGALLAGGIFLLHPLAVDSVIYLSGRGSLLVLLFLLGALWCYGRERPGIFSWLLFIACAASAFLSKESAVALLPLLLCYHICLGKRWSELFVFYVPLLLGGAIAAIMKWDYLVGASRGLFQIGGEFNISSIWDYWPISLAQWPALLRLFFRPDLQAIDHQVYAPASWLDPQVLGGVAIWCALPVLFYALRRWRSPVFFFALWVFGSLFVTNSVFPIIDPFAERHFYLALPAVGWLFAYLFLRLLERAPGAVWSLPFLLLGAVAYAGTAPRIEVWRSSESLWLDAYQKYPKKFRVVFNAFIAMRENGGAGGEEKGLPILLGFLKEQRPGTLTYEEHSLVVHITAGIVRSIVEREGGNIWKRGREILGKNGDFWSELILLEAAIGKSPDPSWLHAWQEAAEKLKEVRLASGDREPNFAINSFYLLRARYFARTGNVEAAVKDYEDIFRQFSGRYFPYWTVREELGDLYMKQGKESLAIQQYEDAIFQYRALKRFPPMLYQKLTEIFLRRKNYLRASELLGQLTKIATDDKSIRKKYAELLHMIGNKAALRQMEEAKYYSEHAIAPDDLQEAVGP